MFIAEHIVVAMPSSVKDDELLAAGRVTGRHQGGGWVWNGVSPNLELAKNTTEPAMKACKKAGVREAVCTMWQDNGAETPMLSGLPSIVRFAEHGFAEEVSEEAIDAQIEFLTGCSAEALNLLGSLDHVNSSCTYDNPSKFLLYQDVLTGLFENS